MLIGMTQDALARQVGLTFQQIQKYERGQNRIGAGRLYQLATALDVPISFFFDDLPPEPGESAALSAGVGEGVPSSPEGLDPFNEAETATIVAAFEAISDNEVRRKVLDLTRAMARQSTNNAAEDNS
jgi:transcriptional regulator with XRE-family HTH domain